MQKPALFGKLLRIVIKYIPRLHAQTLHELKPLMSCQLMLRLGKGSLVSRYIGLVGDICGYKDAGRVSGYGPSTMLRES